MHLIIFTSLSAHMRRVVINHYGCRTLQMEALHVFPHHYQEMFQSASVRPVVLHEENLRAKVRDGAVNCYTSAFGVVQSVEDWIRSLHPSPGYTVSAPQMNLQR